MEEKQYILKDGDRLYEVFQSGAIGNRKPALRVYIVEGVKKKNKRTKVGRFTVVKEGYRRNGEILYNTLEGTTLYLENDRLLAMSKRIELEITANNLADAFGLKDKSHYSIEDLEKLIEILRK